MNDNCKHTAFYVAANGRRVCLMCGHVTEPAAGGSS